ncbi:MAG: hypothetical protein AAB358_00980 [Patescibacteria group bacterium]
MIKTKLSTGIKTVYVYLLAIFAAAVFSSPFRKIYDIFVLEKSNVGYGFFSGRNEELIVGGLIFSFLFFLALFVSIFIEEKKWLIWLIGIILPITIIIQQESDYILWSIIFTLAGFVLGWLIRFIYKKIKK